MSKIDLIEPKPMQVSLLTAPAHPLETVWCVWEQSRHNKPVPSPEEVAYLNSPAAQGWGNSDKLLSLLGWQFDSEPEREDWRNWEQTSNWKEDRPDLIRLREFREKFTKTVTMLLSEDVPVTENMTFVFLIENMPISLREQLVRHRIGVNQDARIGADIIPHVADSAWWSQTTRVLDLSSFYDDGMFFVPDGLPDQKIVVEDSPYGDRWLNPLLAYHGHMMQTQKLYRDLLAAGVHVEDARQIIPLGMTHRMTWQLNLKALGHIIGKRSCWIAQLGIWGKLIEGIAECLSREVHPLLRNIVNPPCISGDEFKACPYGGINAERIDGRDGVMAPCPLWLNYHVGDAILAVSEATEPQWARVGNPIVTFDANDPNTWYAQQYESGMEVSFPGGWVARTKALANRMAEGRAQYLQLWGRNVDTGKLLANTIEEAATGIS